MARKSFDTRTFITWVGGAACALWMALSVYQEFLDVDPDQYGFKSPEVEARMQNCSGSFQQRYECKEAIILEKQHESFMIWLEKVVITFGPPGVLVFLWRRTRPKNGKSRSGYEPPPPISRRRVR